MSMLEELGFEERAEKQKTSFMAYVLIVNFSDVNILQLNYILETPLEVSSIEWHPMNPYILYGGMTSGQMCVWDLAHSESRVTDHYKKSATLLMPDEEKDKT